VVGQGVQVASGSPFEFRDAAGDPTTTHAEVASVAVNLSVDLPSSAPAPRPRCPAGCSYPTSLRKRRTEVSRRTRGGQDGVAMITVMMIMVVLSLLMVAAIGYATQSAPLSRRTRTGTRR
jgi:hypothetical protein